MRTSAFSSCCLLYLSLATGLATAGELRDYHHVAWTLENGLGSVFDVQQAPDGYLWLTTSTGIFRFDGVNLQSADDATHGAVNNKDLDTVFVSRTGAIWFSTRRKGILRWADGHLTDFPDRRCTPGVRTGSIVEDPQGSLWVQSSAGLAHLHDGVCELAGASMGYPGGYPKGILMDRRGRLWVQMRTGDLFLRPDGRGAFQRVPGPAGYSSEYAYLHEAPDGSIWISDALGLRPITDPSGSLLPAAVRNPRRTGPTRIDNFVFAPDGTLWAGTRQGVERIPALPPSHAGGTIEPGRGAVFTTRQGLSSNVVWKVIVDREGTIWVATNSGLDQLRRSPLSTFPLPLTSEHQFGIAPGDNGSLWVGSRSVPLTHVTADGRATSYPATHQVLGIHRDHNGVIWSSGIGEHMLWRIEGAAVTPVDYPAGEFEPVADIAVDRNQDPWISIFTPHLFRRSAGRWLREDLNLGRKPGVIGATSEAANGDVWIAFSNKLVHWDGREYHRYGYPDGPLNPSVATVAIRGNHVWLGGLTAVVLFCNGQFHRMRWKDPNLPGPVTGVAETESGDLWLNGYSGIVHVPAAELSKWLRDPAYPVDARRLDALDGLPGLVAERWPEPSLVASPDGRLWFATSKGVSYLDPATFDSHRNRLPPPVVITEVRRDGVPLPATNGLRLEPGTHNLQIDYTALSLAIPERVRFRYMLDGADADWQDAGTRRQAFYNNLPAGPYRFRVIACNNDGVWNEAGAALDLTLLPAYDETWWFRTLCVLAAAAALSFLVRLRILGVQRRLEARHAERLDERERIARELHDTLLQSLFGLMLQFQHAADQLPGDNPARATLSQALDQAETVMQEGRDRVKALRAGHQDGDTLLEELCAVAHQFDYLETTIFERAVDGRRRPLKPAIQEEILLIGREALVNAFTHAGARRIRLEIDYQRRHFQLVIQDNGCGIDAAIREAGHRQNHWGLPGMRERAAKLGAVFTLASPPQGGTRIELRVPAVLAYEKERRLLRRLWSYLHRTVQSEDAPPA